MYVQKSDGSEGETITYARSEGINKNWVLLLSSYLCVLKVKRLWKYQDFLIHCLNL